jgi:hypothetical protein
MHSVWTLSRNTLKGDLYQSRVPHSIRLADCCSRVFTDWKSPFFQGWPKGWLWNKELDLLVQHPRFEQYICYSQFKEFRYFSPEIWVDDSKKESDPRYKFSMAIHKINSLQRMFVRASKRKDTGKSMSAWRLRITASDGLPNISFVVWKPEPLGTEFKTVDCPATVVMITNGDSERWKRKEGENA